MPGEPARADEAYDAFVKSLSGGGGGGGSDAVPTGALLAACPLGDDRRTAEQWLWLLTAVLEALARETEVVREVAAYASRDAPAESRVDDPQKEDPLDAERARGARRCGERARRGRGPAPGLGGRRASRLMCVNVVRLSAAARAQ